MDGKNDPCCQRFNSTKMKSFSALIANFALLDKDRMKKLRSIKMISVLISRYRISDPTFLVRKWIHVANIKSIYFRRAIYTDLKLFLL